MPQAFPEATAEDGIFGDASASGQVLWRWYKQKRKAKTWMEIFPRGDATTRFLEFSCEVWR